ncbi:RNA binding protein [Aphelenchoides avenae]|nr:RNA binding protein [Aphelenchus avenae]
MAAINGDATVKTEDTASNGNGTAGNDNRQVESYVVVADSEDGERIELPANVEDNSLGLHTLTHAFPGAHGLKFKNPATGASRALAIDSTGTKFLPPPGGWEGKVFFVIAAPAAAEASKPRSNSEQNPKRKKMMDEAEYSSDGDSEGAHFGAGGQVTAKQKRMDTKAQPDEEAELRCSDLIVLGLPYKLSEDEFREHFEQYGKVALAEIKKGRNGESKGFGFIRMDNYDAQVQVLGKISHQIGGRKCQVKVPLSKRGEALEMETLANSKLFIGRLQEKTSAETLRNFFLDEAKKIDPKAAIVDLFIPKPFRHFAFITFSNPRIAKELIRKGDFIVDGNSVSVSEAAPKQAVAPFINGPPGMVQRGQYYDAPPARGYAEWEAPRMPPRGYEQPFLNEPRGMGGYAPSAYSPAPPMVHGGHPSGSQSLATGLETLNLNNMKPESQPASSTPPPGPPPQGRYGPPQSAPSRSSYGPPAGHPAWR